MHLYIVEHITLKELFDSSSGPASGDVIAYTRDMQDPFGTEQIAFRARGVTVIHTGDLFSWAALSEINQNIDSFLKKWSGADSLRNDFCPYFLMAPLLPKTYGFGALVRFGEILRCLLERHPETSEILSDIRDGMDSTQDSSAIQGSCPKRVHLLDFVRKKNIRVTFFDPANLIHSPFISFNDLSILRIFKLWIGGFRPRYFIGRIRLRIHPKTPNRFYVFLNHGLSHVVETLAESGEVDVCTDQTMVGKSSSIRYDHLVPTISFRWLSAIAEYRKRVRNVRVGAESAIINGIDYRAALTKSLTALSKLPLLIAAIQASQMERMLHTLGIRRLVINGESSPATRHAISRDVHFGYKVIYIGHGLNAIPYGYWPVANNFPRVTFAVPGREHLDLYAHHLTGAAIPRQEIVPTPIFSQVRHAAGKRRTPPARRILILAPGPGHTDSIVRQTMTDPYLIDVFACAKKWIAKNYSVTFRAHHDFDERLTRSVMDLYDLGRSLKLDRVKNFGDSLGDHDLVVTNISTCHYQALLVGWPTIFYERNFDRRNFISFLAREECPVPSAATPQDLERLVSQTLESGGFVETFAELFREKYGDAFIGPDAENAERRLADFLISDSP